MPDQPTESATIRTLLVIPVEVAGRLAVSVAAADLGASTETLTLTASDGSAVPHREVTLDRGMRLHVIDAPEGEVTLTYDATVALTAAEPEQVSDADSFTYILPSRYCPSDRLTGLANTEFGHIEADAVRARRIVSWVHERLSYVQGTTTATDDALTPLLGGLGVCRDYAHLVVALARAVGMPARYVDGAHRHRPGCRGRRRPQQPRRGERPDLLRGHGHRVAGAARRGPGRARHPRLTRRPAHQRVWTGPSRKYVVSPMVLPSPWATIGAHSER
jgi:transglutaminase-like putative cysteine protease